MGCIIFIGSSFQIVANISSRNAILSWICQTRWSKTWLETWPDRRPILPLKSPKTGTIQHLSQFTQAPSCKSPSDRGFCIRNWNGHEGVRDGISTLTKERRLTQLLKCVSWRGTDGQVEVRTVRRADVNAVWSHNMRPCDVLESRDRNGN
jgi:hypothetical protein